MHLTKLRELQLTAPSQPGRPTFVSAASGLVRVRDFFYVVADDELSLGVFPVAGNAPGKLIRLLAGELPLDRDERKRKKPDFESLTFLPPFGRYKHGALLVVGSGSRERRERWVLLPFDEHGADENRIRVIDAAHVYAAIAKEVDDINIEGTLIVNDRLLLMHRGNKSHTRNAIASFDLHAILKSLDEDDELRKTSMLALQHYDLGAIKDVPLCFTDGMVLPDGCIAFSAVAEDTSDSFHDGPCVGAAIGILDAHGKVQMVNYLDDRQKIEGIYAERDGAKLKLWLVTDDDDPAIPGLVLTGELIW
jgi:hypothetical protein